MEQAIAALMRRVEPGITHIEIEELQPIPGGFSRETFKRDVAALLHGVTGEEADRIRGRASTLGALTDVPVPADQQPVRDAHQKLGYALQDTISDLDVLQRAGETRADEALTRLRMFLMPTIVNHVAAISVGGGMVGRG